MVELVEVEGSREALGVEVEVELDLPLPFAADESFNGVALEGGGGRVEEEEEEETRCWLGGDMADGEEQRKEQGRNFQPSQKLDDGAKLLDDDDKGRPLSFLALIIGLVRRGREVVCASKSENLVDGEERERKRKGREIEVRSRPRTFHRDREIPISHSCFSDQRTYREELRSARPGPRRRRKKEREDVELTPR